MTKLNKAQTEARERMLNEGYFIHKSNSLPRHTRAYKQLVDMGLAHFGMISAVRLMGYTLTEAGKRFRVI